jgi:mxaJ protein
MFSRFRELNRVCARDSCSLHAIRTGYIHWPERWCASKISITAVLFTLLLAVDNAAAAERELRVCADPNNLPFSNSRGEGFENRIAELIARELDASLRYTWWAQRRGFVRNTLREGACDVIIGVPAGYDPVLTTRPYYRSTYVFVHRDEPGAVRSLDDPRIGAARIGVQLVGDDYANTPPVHALARRGIVANVRGYTVYGDYARPDPPADVIRAVASGEVDVAVAWGPLAGYFATRQPSPLRLAVVSPLSEGPLPFAYDISMGVRRGDRALRDEIDRFLQRRRGEIDRVLDAYGVPRLDRPARLGEARS